MSASGLDAFGVVKAIKNGASITGWESFLVHDVLLEILCGVLGLAIAAGECTARPTSQDVNAGPDKEELDVLDHAGLLPVDTDADSWNEWTTDLVRRIPDDFVFGPGCANAMRGVLSDINTHSRPPTGRVRVQCTDVEVQTTPPPSPDPVPVPVPAPVVVRESARIKKRRADAAAAAVAAPAAKKKK